MDAEYEFVSHYTKDNEDPDKAITPDLIEYLKNDIGCEIEYARDYYDDEDLSRFKRFAFSLIEDADEIGFVDAGAFGFYVVRQETYSDKYELTTDTLDNIYYEAKCKVTGWKQEIWLAGNSDEFGIKTNRGC